MCAVHFFTQMSMNANEGYTIARTEMLAKIRKAHTDVYARQAMC